MTAIIPKDIPLSQCTVITRSDFEKIKQLAEDRENVELEERKKEVNFDCIDLIFENRERD